MTRPIAAILDQAWISRFEPIGMIQPKDDFNECNESNQINQPNQSVPLLQPTPNAWHNPATIGLTFEMPEKQPKSRSPLKAKPVRTPGQSLQEARIDLFFDKLVYPLTFTFGLFVMAYMKWHEELTGFSSSPWLWTVMFAASFAFLSYRMISLLPYVKNLRRAEEGEKAVGQFLERLRGQGYHVFHDVVGDSFNIDHVLIGPAGILTVETKTWSKPVRGKAKIEFDGQKLTAWGREPDRNPVIQAQAQAGWLQALLKESTGQSSPLRPVILFPGWFIENTREFKSSVWVLNPKALPSYLENASTQLKPDQIKLFSFHLSRFIRSTEVEREEARRSMFRKNKGPGSQIGL